VPLAEINGITVNYIDEGAGDALLLIHNVIANIDAYVDVRPTLGKHFRLIAPDLRGHGKTGKTEDEAQAKAFFDFDLIADDIYQLLRRRGVERVFVVGQAYWGVSTAMTLFYHHPEMVRGIVAAACNIIPSPPGGNPFDDLGETAKRNFHRMQDMARDQGLMAVFEERKRLRTFWSEKLLNNPAVMARFAAMYAETSPTAFRHFPLISHERHAAILASLKRERLPVMMLMGAEDSHNDSMIALMRKDYPDTHVVLIPDSGHYPASENPGDFNRAIMDFCAGVARFDGR
jgi:3-oxoadipate enol-lactonase